MNALKCPNPSCPYLFDPTTVPPGVVLSCPRCGMRFTLGPPAPPPSSPATTSPTATFPGASIAGHPSAPGHSSAPAAAGTNPAFSDMSQEPARTPLVRSRAQVPVHGSRLQSALLVLVSVVALSAAGVAVWYKLTHKAAPPPTDPATVFKDLNLSIEAPPNPWTRDEDMKAKLGSPYKLVYRRDNPEAFIAIGAQDFDPSSPRPSELRNGLLQPLNTLLEPGTLAEFEPLESTWMGKDVKGFKFTGQLRTGPSIEGEAYAVSFKGFGYWFLAWTGANEIYQEQMGAFAATRKTCRLLELRKNWKEKQSPIVAFKNNVLGYTFLDPEGIWKEETNEELVKGEGPQADKLLRAQLKRKGNDIPEQAELIVYILDEGGDPLQVARTYIESRANANVELFGKNTFTEYTEKLEGDVMPDPVDGNAPVIVLRSTNSTDPNQSRLWVISAITVKGKDGEKTVAVCGQCLWRERATFDTRLVQLAKSLRAGG